MHHLHMRAASFKLIDRPRVQPNVEKNKIPPAMRVQRAKQSARPFMMNAPIQVISKKEGLLPLARHHRNLAELLLEALDQLLQREGQSLGGDIADHHALGHLQ